MVNYIEITSWITTKSIQSNKPTKWQKLLAKLKIRPLEKPKYWYECEIVVLMPHPLGSHDIIMTRNLQQFHVMSRLFRNNANTKETFKISSIEPMERMCAEVGKTVILSSCCSEMDPNTQPYGGQIV